MLNAPSHGEFCIGAAYHYAAGRRHVIACDMKTPGYRGSAGALDFYGPDPVTGQFKQQVNFSTHGRAVVAGLRFGRYVSQRSLALR